MTYRCLDKDCRKTFEKPLVLRFPARSYKAGQYGLKEDRTVAAYQVEKCPYCRSSVEHVHEPRT